MRGLTKNGRGREVQTIWHNTRGTVARLNPIVRTTKGRLHAGLLCLAHIANTAPVMVWMSDAEKQITFLNQTWLDYTGLPLEAALRVADLVPW